jgi:hypothetical protein
LTARRTLEKPLVTVVEELRRRAMLRSPSAAAMPLRRYGTASLSSTFSSSECSQSALMEGKAEKNSALIDRIFSRSSAFTGAIASTCL